jgi:Flp pilus assembly pilin Flp
MDPAIGSSGYFQGRTSMKLVIKRLWKEEEGQDLIEYALLTTLISLALVAAMGTLATAIDNAFGSAATQLNT